MICGCKRFGRFALQVEDRNFIGTVFEPRAGRVQRKLRADRPEAAERVSIEKRNAFREPVRIEEGVGEIRVRLCGRGLH